MNLSKNLVIFCMTTFMLQGQVVDKIKQRAQQNQSPSSSPSPSRSNSNSSSGNNDSYNYNRRSSRRSNSYNYNNNGGYYSGNSGGYNDGNCNDNNISGRNTSTSSSALDGQIDVLGRKDSVPEVVCIEFSENVSFANTPLGRAWVHNPHLRLVWGVLSTEFRYFDVIDRSPRTGKLNHYNNFDWQVLQFNLLCRKEIKFRIGLGFTNDLYLSRWVDSTGSKTSVYYMDFGAGGEVYPIPSLKFRLEYRANRDFKTNVSPRTMWAFGAEYKIFGDHTTRLVGFLGVNGNRIRMFEDNDLTFWSVGPSVTLRLQ